MSATAPPAKPTQFVAPKPWTPTVRQIDAIVPGCRFHVGSPVENFRVGQCGGEEAFTRQMTNAIRPGDVFYDIGTCIGFVAVHAGRRGATVVGFEPEPQLRRRALENLSLNGLSGVRVMDWAVSDAEGAADLFSDGPHGHSPSLAAAEHRTPVRVRTRPIDAALAAGELPPADLVKLDIEGAEVRALRGMRGLLTGDRRPRALFLEVHPPMIAAMGDRPEDVTDLLTASGYRLDWEEGRWEQTHQVWTAGRAS